MVTVTQAWLGSLGSGGGSTVDNADINEITKVGNDLILVGMKNYLSYRTRRMRLLKWGTAMEMGVGVLSLLCLLDIRPSLTWRSRSIRKMPISSSIGVA